MVTYELVTAKGTTEGKVDKIVDLEQAIPRFREIIRQNMPISEAYLHMQRSDGHVYKSFAFSVDASGEIAYAGKC